MAVGPSLALAACRSGWICRCLTTAIVSGSTPAAIGIANAAAPTKRTISQSANWSLITFISASLIGWFYRFEKNVNIRLFGLQPIGVGHTYGDPDPTGPGFEKHDLSIEQLRLSVLHFHRAPVFRVLGFHSINLPNAGGFGFFRVGDKRSCCGLDVLVRLVDRFHIFYDPQAEPNQSVRCSTRDTL